jgi:hypothetical protein
MIATSRRPFGLAIYKLPHAEKQLAKKFFCFEWLKCFAVCTHEASRMQSGIGSAMGE